MILKGRDQSLGKTADQAISKMDTLSSKIKSGIGFGALMAIGNRAVGALSNGIQDLGQSFNTSSLAWKSFNGNMQILGASGSQIQAVQKDLENYAQATVYNASDMASTYAQLAAVGTKNTAKLVKGFGGLAAAAENPSQAMKTLSQQATQMAGRPTVAWQDFKLMLEQTPSGIAAVAKQMGMSTQDMVQAVQDGKIKTEDFFKAVEQVGNSDAFNNMAQNFKSVGQAMDGLYEDVTAKFMPVWDKLQDIGINAVQGIISAMDRIDVGALTAKIDGFIAGAKKSFDDFWSSFINSGAVDSLRNLFDDLGPAIDNVASSLGGASGIFSTLGSVIGTVVDKVAELADKIAQFVANMSPGQVQAFADVITGLGVAFLTIKGVSSIATKIKKIGDTAQNAAGPIKSLAGKIKSIFTKGEGTSGTAEEVKKIGDNAEKSSRRVSNSVSKINAKFKGACNIIKQFGNSIRDILKQIGQSITSIIKQLGTSISQIVKSLGTAISTAAQGIGTGLATAFRGLGEALAMVPPTTWLAIGAAALMVGAAFALVGTQADGLSQILGALAPIVDTVVAGIVAVAQTLPAIIQAIGDAIQSTLQGVATVVESIGTVIKDAFQGIADVISSVGDAIKSALDGVADIITAFGDNVKSVLDGVSDAFKGLGDGIKSILDGVADVVESFGKSVLNAGKGVEHLANGLKNITNLNLGDMTASLAAVALGIG